eukprot:m.270008 g.270008  ORF g.270008 m.270008 type:complete len:97 (-) comp16261_c0_seq5:1441-1731(-)
MMTSLPNIKMHVHGTVALAQDVDLCIHPSDALPEVQHTLAKQHVGMPEYIEVHGTVGPTYSHCSVGFSTSVDCISHNTLFAMPASMGSRICAHRAI